jgi:hypothetical protein
MATHIWLVTWMSDLVLIKLFQWLVEFRLICTISSASCLVVAKGCGNPCVENWYEAEDHKAYGGPAVPC